MSTWYEVGSEAIEIDKKEVNIYVHSNEWGNIYAILSFDQVEEMHKKIMDQQARERNE